MIPTIVSTDPVYVSQSLIDDRTNGYGRLTEITDAEVYEKLNGEYTAEITIPRKALNAYNLKRFGLVRIKPNPWQSSQVFRINRIKRQLVNGNIVLQLNHISYDLNKLPALPFIATGMSNVISAFSTYQATYNPFTFWSDIENTDSVVVVSVPMSWRSVFGGVEGSILDVFGGEFVWDNLSVNLKPHRGENRDVKIRYGLNIIEFTQEENIANTYDAVLGYAAVAENFPVWGDIVSDGEEIAYPFVKVVDLTDKIEEGVTPTGALLTQLTEAWVSANHPKKPQIGMTVDFTALRQSRHYDILAELEDVRLGDTVTVVIPEMGISQTAKVTGMRYDPIREVIKEIELGSYRPRLSSTISNIGKAARDLLNAYPIGSVYSTYSKTNPSATLGGTWSLVSQTGDLSTYRRIR